jgi:hypothetical protein
MFLYPRKINKVLGLRATLDKGPKPKTQGPIWNKLNLELDPSSHFKKYKGQWVCLKAQGPIQRSNLKKML